LPRRTIAASVAALGKCVKDNKRTNSPENRPKVALTRRRRPGNPPHSENPHNAEGTRGYPPLIPAGPFADISIRFWTNIFDFCGASEAEDLKALLGHLLLLSQKKFRTFSGLLKKC